VANKVLFGLERVYIAMLTEATGVYAAPVAIPGAVNMSLDPEGGQDKFYADNIAYYVSNTNNGYTGELEAALIPDTILADMLGWGVDSSGMLVEISDGLPQPFALLFEVAGNEANKRYVFYKCTADRPKVEHGTKTDTTEVKTSTLALTMTPIEIDGTWLVKAAIERTVSNAAVFDAWYTAVTEPAGIVS